METWLEIIIFIGIIGFLVFKKQKQVGDTFDNTHAAVQIHLDHKMLTCSFCGHDKFQKRECLLNTTLLTLFHLQMFNQSARGYICRKCGKVELFKRRNEQLEVLSIRNQAQLENTPEETS